MIATTKEQSRRLLELGIDPSTADMYYRVAPYSAGIENHPVSIEWKSGNALIPPEMPAWSFEALFSLMPRLVKRKDADELYHPFITLEYTGFVIGYEEILYGYDGVFLTARSKSPINAAFEMVCWLKENNYI